MNKKESVQPISIVKAKPSDAPAIYELASKHSGSTQPWVQERIEGIIADTQGHYVLVAKQAQSIVGYGITRFAWGKIHLIDIVVKEEMRGQGIGEKIMAKLIDQAKSQKLSEVYLEVRAGNAPAIKLYQSLSFKVRFILHGLFEEDILAMYLPLLEKEKAT